MTKIIKRIFIWLLVILLVIFAGVSAYVEVYGKDAVLTLLNSTLNRSVYFKDINYRFPLGLTVYDINVEGLVQAKKIRAYVDPNSFVQKKVTLSSLVLHEPIFTYYRESDDTVSSSQKNYANVVKLDKDEEENYKMIYINKLQVKNGRFHYVDKSTEDSFSFKLEKLNILASKITVPAKHQKVFYELAGYLTIDNIPFSGGMAVSSGWMDVASMDMQGKFNIVEPDGKSSLTAEIVSKRNDMHVEGELKASDFLKLQRPEATLENAVDSFFVNALSTMGVEIDAKFAFDTKMDDFRVGNIQFEGSVETVEP